MIEPFPSFFVLFSKFEFDFTLFNLLFFFAAFFVGGPFLLIFLNLLFFFLISISVLYILFNFNILLLLLLFFSFIFSIFEIDSFLFFDDLF